MTYNASQVITFTGTSKDNASDPSSGTTVSQGEAAKANSEPVEIISGSNAGSGPDQPSDGPTFPEGRDGKENVIPEHNAIGGGTKRPYDSIADHADQPDREMEGGGPQAKKREVAPLKFKGAVSQEEIDEEVLVPIPKRLYEQLTDKTIDLDDSATEPESSSEYEVNGRLKRKYLT